MAVVYEHIRNDNGKVFYVGIGRDVKRAYTRYGRNEQWRNVVEECGYSVEIVHTGLDEKTAKRIEKFLIGVYGKKIDGRGELVNITNGGDGAAGAKRSDMTRRKMSEARKGMSFSTEHRRQISIGKMGQNKGHKNNRSKRTTNGVKVWACLKEATDDLNINYKTIRNFSAEERLIKYNLRYI